MIGDKEIGLDQGLNLALGGGALINSALWILAPSKVHVRSSLSCAACCAPRPNHPWVANTLGCVVAIKT